MSSRITDERGWAERLAALGIIRLALPFEGAGINVNINTFLIENQDGSLTLLDTGYGDQESVLALWRAIEAAGRQPEEVSRIVVTHGHIDHFGAARALIERHPTGSGPTVLLHPGDFSRVLATTDYQAENRVYEARFRSFDVPEDEIEGVRRAFHQYERSARRLEPEMIAPIPERLEFARFEAEVLHTPGHSMGQVCVLARDERILFANDLILETTTPTPLMELGEPPPRPLCLYLESLRRVEQLCPFDWILPGHGEPIRDGLSTIRGLHAVYQRRQARLLKLLAGGPHSAYDLIPGLFGRHRPGETFFTLSEVVGNLEVLEESGIVSRLGDGRFALAA